MLELNEIYCGDCLDVMKQIDDNSIDLVITSPPYDNLRDYDGYSFGFESIAKELFRVIKQGGIVVWVVGDAVINGSETGTSFRQALYFKNIGFRLHDTMIYEKDGMRYPELNRYYQIFEYMFVFSKGKPKTTNLIKDRKTKHSGSLIINSERRRDGSLKKSYATVHRKRYNQTHVKGNIWKFGSGFNKSTKDKFAFEQPALFPEKLANDHIISWSNEDDIVLDPMCGSGTTCKMAKINNRNFIGIDISEQYCNIARKRVRISKVKTSIKNFFKEGI